MCFSTLRLTPYLALRTYLRREAFDRLDVVPHDVGRRGENDIDQFFLAVEIGDQYLYGGIGVGFPYGTHGSGPMGGTPSGRSSLSTEVITQCFSPIKETERASLRGSSLSGGNGFPEAVAQNLHERVQISPKIMKVAVRRLQHSA